ncbi:MAG: mechanosensitive ion channel domain-containing protein [Myxococcota bacterium]|nr:mechanosensitive ion channel domain-containing protein [Myxococcota bacterium]
MEKVTEFLNSNIYAKNAAIIAGAVVLSIVAYLIARRVILRGLRYFTQKTKFSWDDIILEQGVFNKLALLAPAIVIYYFGYAFDQVGVFLQRGVSSYVLFVFLLAVNDLLTAVNLIYNRYEFAKSRPIKGYIQVVKLIVFSIGGLTIIALVMGKSPAVVISGLGALTAVLMLVFKDSILSLVASIQLATNDLIRIGDWVEMPKFNANGEVSDIALNAVKIQNFDKTITSIPTHRFLEDSFKNWRGMAESGTRRILKSIHLDQTSVRFLTEEELDKLEKVAVLSDYIKGRRQEITQHNQDKSVDLSISANGRRLTNLGTFRQYVFEYLHNNENIRNDLTLLVRLLQPTNQGIAVQIYCFSADQRWAQYEGIQGDIIDHLLAVLGDFDLRVFQDPVGSDFAKFQS